MLEAGRVDTVLLEGDLVKSLLDHEQLWGGGDLVGVERWLVEAMIERALHTLGGAEVKGIFELVLEEMDDGGRLYGVLLLDDGKQLLFVLLEVQEVLGDETRLR